MTDDDQLCLLDLSPKAICTMTCVKNRVCLHWEHLEINSAVDSAVDWMPVVKSLPFDFSFLLTSLPRPVSGFCS